MNGYDFSIAGIALTALPSGALWWPENRTLVVSDLHLGKSSRVARRGGLMLPPYETRDTLARLETDIYAARAGSVICLGDSFDDLTATDSLSEEETLWITRMQAGRRWVWIEGNHDPGPTNLSGTHLAELPVNPLTFRHIARPGFRGEISGHYHPKATIKARGRAITRPCFLYDSDRLILPAFGTYTGGLRTNSPVFSNLMRPEARAILTGPNPQAIPMPHT